MSFVAILGEGSPFPPRPAGGEGETKDSPRGRERPLQAVPRPTPEALGGPISSSNPLFSNVLNKFCHGIQMVHPGLPEGGGN